MADKSYFNNGSDYQGKSSESIESSENTTSRPSENWSDSSSTANQSSGMDNVIDSTSSDISDALK